MDTFKIVKEVEKITAGTTTATITGMYEYSGRIDGIKVRVGTSEQLFGSDVFVAEVSGKSYSVNITGLHSGTKYHYRYEVDYGGKDDYLTEVSSFTTQAESPTVKTVDVLALDSTTYRVKCEVMAGGGQEVTERGICWNTYGDPTMDDATLQHASNGIGQYTIRMEDLTSNTQYYVRAYAKNVAGIGFGEVLEFRTGGSTTTPQVSTVEVNNVSYHTAQCLGNVSGDGGLAITERGACWGLEPDPTVNVHHAVAEGTDMGNYTVTMDGLQPNTTYHVRCYAVNEKGTSYGEELTFTTTEGKPTVTTSAVTDVTSTSAKGGGTVTDEGASNVTERGLCWSLSHEPTLNDSHAASGMGAGNYTVSMTGLTPNKTYYARAYATNGQGTSYGAEVSFTAQEGLPVVTTQAATDIAATTAKGHGTVTDEGGSPVTERGICWSTAESPTIDDSHATGGTGSGAYAVNLTGLTPGTKYYMRAYAKNTQGLTYGEQVEFTTEATLPTVQTGSISGTTVGGTVTNDGGATVTERGVCWSATNAEPTTADAHGSSGTGTGQYTVELTDLEPGTTYHVRAYATNAKGTAYGDTKTLATEANLPTVTTGEVSNVTQTTAQGSGNVTNDGGADVTERGVCWGTSHNPTTSGSHATSGTGTGSFTVNMTGLTANTTYYVRAYAKNSAGTQYGTEVSFTTSQSISAPTVTTAQVTNIAQTTATGGGNVTADGGANVTERGICWGTGHNPTTSGSHASNGTGTGSYTVNMTGLASGTTYYVRAYARNSQGTSYGSEVSFTTQVAVTTPTVTTAQVTNITQTTATGGGNVTASGNATVTARGICWGTGHNPTVSGSHAQATQGGTGTFTVNMTGLTANTTYYVRAYATNSAGTAYGTEVSFTTSQNVTVPTVTTSDVTNITQTTATGGGNVTASGNATVTARGICWSTSHNPTVSGSHAQASQGGTGTFTVNMTGLTANTTYYVRAYATNSAGTAYGTEVSFTTSQNVTVPTVTTAQVTNITQTTATGGGNVTASGNATVTARGICWSTNHNPTVSGSHAQASQGGTGSFTVNMTGLTANTTYYVRAYATNSAGTAYGTEVSFTTSQNVTAPTVTTSDVTNITQTTATGGGNVTASGNATVTARGICWSTSHNPTTSGSHANSGTGTGSFTVNMTGLTANTTYYVRAYAINSTGTSYGSEVSFTTQQAITLPTVTTSQVTNVTQTTATGGGNVTNSGGATVTERGICWSTNHNPTVSGSHAQATQGGTGTFTVNMTGLTANTTYYVRAYATNSAGTAYGTEVSFTTSQNVTVPTVTTSDVTNITQTTATGGGNVTASGNATVTARGVCWSTNHNPTVSGSHAQATQGGTGTFTVGMTGLTANTTYYVRAYATNSAGTAYGTEVSFTTSQNVTVPTVTTSEVTNITQTTATGGGNVTASGNATVTARGICWSTSHNPTVSGSHAQASQGGTGTFTVNMTGLTANTTYYVRAYATNSAGTAYGTEVSFTTAQIPTYTITVSASPTSGGTVNGGGTYQQGQSCTVSAAAATGYTFLRWTENGSQVSTNANYQFTVSSSRTLVAQFQQQSYTISTNVNPSGSGSVTGGGTYTYGQTCTLTASPANGYTFSQWQDGNTNNPRTITVTGNATYTAYFNAQPQAPTGAINGLFTINANGDQVYFSQGNLQYQASTNTWRFATNQYDYIGDANSNISQTYSGWIDLFGWGTSGNNHGAVCYQPWSTSQTNSDYYAYGQSTYNLYDQTGQADWGYNAISNGGNQNHQWRTLTSGEWVYVFNTRSTASGIRYAKANVNNVRGVILLPDDWSASYYSLSNTNQNGASFGSNVISSTQWSTLEQHGAVFLPAAAIRNGASVFVDGYYWSASYSNSDSAYGAGVFFNDSHLYPQLDNYRYFGQSVRLVRSAQ